MEDIQKLYNYLLANNIIMLTYQLHTRHLVVPSGNELSFPNRVKVKLKLSPGIAFGTENKNGRTLIKARAASVLMNVNNGKWVAQSNPPLEPFDVVIENIDSVLQLKGDLLTYEFYCSSLSALDAMLTAFKFIYPTILNLEFSEPPIILHASGDVGGVDFRWEHKAQEWIISMRTIVPEKLEKHVGDSFDNLRLFNDTNNRRLAAALSYFHLAVRLNVCGDSPWEFMAETILNYCKAIEILLVSSKNTKDDVRKELKSLEYSQEEIEGDFIPLMILRSCVDVAHPKIAIFKPRDLRVLYVYLSRSENVIRELLCRILKKVKNNEYAIRQEDELTLDAEDGKGMDKLVAEMELRLKVPIPSVS